MFAYLSIMNIDVLNDTGFTFCKSKSVIIKLFITHRLRKVDI